MRILVLSNLYPPDVLGGYELACRQVVDALQARGHELRVLTAAPRQPVPAAPHVTRTLRLTDIYDGYWLARLPPAARLQALADSQLVSAHNVHGLLQALEEFRPDVVYLCNLLGLGGLGLLVALHYLRVPWVWQLGDCVPPALCRRPDGRLAEALARQFETLRGHFIVVSRRLLREIETQGVRLPGVVTVLPNWVAGRRRRPRAAVYRPGTPLRVVSAGAIAQHKGMHLIIEAIAQLHAAGFPGVSLDLYGKPADASFQALIQALRLQPCVRLLGPRDHAELAERFAAYDVFAFPTWEREPFGLAPLEALAQGCVPLISRRCGLSEWLVHGVHCLKAERSVVAFAATLRDIMEGRIELEPLARRGCAAVWRDFHLDVILPRIEHLLEQAAAAPRRGAGTPAEAYRLALLGEKLTQLLALEAVPA
jgi:glycogen synthase